MGGGGRVEGGWVLEKEGGKEGGREGGREGGGKKDRPNVCANYLLAQRLASRTSHPTAWTPERATNTIKTNTRQRTTLMSLILYETSLRLCDVCVCICINACSRKEQPCFFLRVNHSEHTLLHFLGHMKCFVLLLLVLIMTPNTLGSDADIVCPHLTDAPSCGAACSGCSWCADVGQCVPGSCAPEHFLGSTTCAGAGFFWCAAYDTPACVASPLACPCDSGTLSTVCTLSADRVLTSDFVVSGSGSMVVNGRLSDNTGSFSVVLSFGGDVHVHTPVWLGGAVASGTPHEEYPTLDISSSSGSVYLYGPPVGRVEETTNRYVFGTHDVFLAPRIRVEATSGDVVVEGATVSAALHYQDQGSVKGLAGVMGSTFSPGHGGLPSCYLSVWWDRIPASRTLPSSSSLRGSDTFGAKAGASSWATAGSAGGTMTVVAGGEVSLDAPARLGAWGFYGRKQTSTVFAPGGAGGSLNVIAASGIQGYGEISAAGGSAFGRYAAGGGRVFLDIPLPLNTNITVTAHGGTPNHAGHLPFCKGYGGSGTIVFASNNTLLVSNALGPISTNGNLRHTRSGRYAIDYQAYSYISADELNSFDHVMVRGNAALLIEPRVGTVLTLAPSLTLHLYDKSRFVCHDPQGDLEAGCRVEIPRGDSVMFYAEHATFMGIPSLHVTFSSSSPTLTLGTRGIFRSVARPRHYGEGSRIRWANHGGLSGGVGVVYGSLTRPASLGSRPTVPTEARPGTVAGGLLTVTSPNSVLVLNGTEFSADADSGFCYGSVTLSNAGGSGGSLRVSAPGIDGWGTFTASAGPDVCLVSGVGSTGGRISLNVTTPLNTSTIVVKARGSRGGSNAFVGAHGTVFDVTTETLYVHYPGSGMERPNDPTPLPDGRVIGANEPYPIRYILVGWDSKGAFRTNQPLDYTESGPFEDLQGLTVQDSIVVHIGSQLEILLGTQTAFDMIRSRLTGPHITLRASADFSMTSSTIHAFSPSETVGPGPGTGTTTSASHGGISRRGGQAYGDPLFPTAPGSRSHLAQPGVAAVGGVLFVHVNGTLTLEASTLDVSGGNGWCYNVGCCNTRKTGGSSGGSLQVHANRLVGISSSSIMSRGGNGPRLGATKCLNGAGGNAHLGAGGGRVLINVTHEEEVWTSLDTPGSLVINVDGGLGKTLFRAGSGTVYYAQSKMLVISETDTVNPTQEEATTPLPPLVGDQIDRVSKILVKSRAYMEMALDEVPSNVWDLPRSVELEVRDGGNVICFEPHPIGCTLQFGSRLVLGEGGSFFGRPTLHVKGVDDDSVLEIVNNGRILAWTRAGHLGNLAASNTNHAGSYGGVVIPNAISYGSAIAPTDLGSVARNTVGMPGTSDIAAGGYLTLEVGTLAFTGDNGVGGAVSVRGNNGMYRGWFAGVSRKAALGGGSGGSLWVTARTGGIVGRGLLSAQGGTGGSGLKNAPGGGGGRIRVDVPYVSENVTTTAAGGFGLGAISSPGTVYYVQDRVITLSQYPHQAMTTVSWTFTGMPPLEEGAVETVLVESGITARLDKRESVIPPGTTLTVSPSAQVLCQRSLPDACTLVVEKGGALDLEIGSLVRGRPAIFIQAKGDLSIGSLIEAHGVVSATADGTPGDRRSYGGRCGTGLFPDSTYGDVTRAVLPGETTNPSENRGGVVGIHVDGHLQLLGDVRANPVGASAAATGGSVTLTAQRLSGSAKVSANGMNGGSGGRIVLNMTAINPGEDVPEYEFPVDVETRAIEFEATSGAACAPGSIYYAHNSTVVVGGSSAHSVDLADVFAAPAPGVDLVMAHSGATLELDGRELSASVSLFGASFACAPPPPLAPSLPLHIPENTVFSGSGSLTCAEGIECDGVLRIDGDMVVDAFVQDIAIANVSVVWPNSLFPGDPPKLTSTSSIEVSAGRLLFEAEPVPGTPLTKTLLTGTSYVSATPVVFEGCALSNSVSATGIEVTIPVGASTPFDVAVDPPSGSGSDVACCGRHPAMSPCQTIQFVLYDVHDGGTLHLAPGVFTGAGDVDLVLPPSKTVTLQGASSSDPGASVIDCQAVSGVAGIRVGSGLLRLVDLTLRNCVGGGIVVDGTGDVELINVVLEGVGAAVGIPGGDFPQIGGLLSVSGPSTSAYLESCTLRKGVAGSGGAVYAERRAQVTLNGTVVETSASLSDGGGISVTDQAVVVVEGEVVIRGNVAGSGRGGAVAVGNSGVLAVAVGGSLVIRANEASECGGLSLSSSAELDVAAGGLVRLEQNRAVGAGGGMCASLSSLEVVDGAHVVLASNVAGREGGGGFFIMSTMDLKGDVEFFNNTAQLGGGGFVEGGVFSGSSGLVMEANVASRGGGLMASRTTLRLSGGRGSRNRAEDRGGFGFWASVDLDVSNLVLDGNEAESDAALLYCSTCTGRMEGVVASNNSRDSVQEAAMLLLSSQVELSSWTWSENKGAGITSLSSVLDVQGWTVERCSAPDGRLMFLSDGSELTLTNTSFVDNTVATGLVVVVGSSSKLDMEGVIFRGNRVLSGPLIGLDRVAEASLVDLGMESNLGLSGINVYRASHVGITGLTGSDASGGPVVLVQSVSDGGVVQVDGVEVDGCTHSGAVFHVEAHGSVVWSGTGSVRRCGDSGLVVTASGANATARLSGLNVEDNVGLERGGGLYLQVEESAEPIVLTDVVVRGNSAPAFGGGVFCGGKGQVRMTRVVVGANEVGADGSGGGVFWESQRPDGLDYALSSENGGGGNLREGLVAEVDGAEEGTPPVRVAVANRDAFMGVLNGVSSVKEYDVAPVVVLEDVLGQVVGVKALEAYAGNELFASARSDLGLVGEALLALNMSSSSDGGVASGPHARFESLGSKGEPGSRGTVQFVVGSLVSEVFSLELRLCLRPGEEKIGFECVPCGFGKFNLDGGGVCYPCPSGGRCNGGASLEAAPGFWRASNSSTSFHQCSAGLCGENGECVEGHTGVVCGVCKPKYFRIGVGRCRACPEGGLAVTGVISVLVFASLMVLMAVAYRYRDYMPSRPKFKSLLGMIQIMSISVSIYDVDWPASFYVPMQWLSVFNFDLLSAGGLGCAQDDGDLSFYVRFLFYGSLPVVVVALAFLVRAVVSQRENAAVLKRRVFSMTLFVLYVIHPGVAGGLLSLFDCRVIDGVAYLREDYRIVCWEGVWHTYSYVAYLLLLGFALGMPGYLAFSLYRSRDRLFSDPESMAKYAFFISEYTRDMYLWELVEMARKVILARLVVFVSEHVIRQLFVAMGVSLATLVLNAIIRPYERRTDGKVQVMSLMALALALFFASMIQSNALPNKAWEVSGSLAVFLCMAVVGVMVAWLTVQELRRSWKVGPEEEGEEEGVGVGANGMVVVGGGGAVGSEDEFSSGSESTGLSTSSSTVSGDSILSL